MIKKISNKNKAKKQKNKYMFLKLALVAFSIYMCVVMVNQQITINKKQQELNNIRHQLEIQQNNNDNLEKVLNSDQGETEKYIEKIARESLGLSKPGEKIFIGIAGEKK